MKTKIEFRVSAQCKRGCSFCLGMDRYVPTAPIIPLGVLKKRIENLTSIKEAYFSVIGGEPLLHPQLPEIVEYIIKKGFDVVITTGGFPKQANPEIVKRLNKLNVQWCLTMHPEFSDELIVLLSLLKLKTETPLALNYYNSKSLIEIKETFLKKIVPVLHPQKEIINEFELFCKDALRQVKRIKQDRENNQQVFHQDDHRFTKPFGNYICPWFMPIDCRVVRDHTKDYKNYTALIMECNSLKGCNELTVMEDGAVVPCCATSQNYAGKISTSLENEKNPKEVLKRISDFRKVLSREIEKQYVKRGLSKLPPSVIYSWVCKEVCGKITVLS